jgi:hypothetical protein
MQVICGKKSCRQPVVPGQLLTGVTIKGKEYLGHYLCVLDMLGKEGTLDAIQKGLLPVYKPDDIINGRLTKFADYPQRKENGHG